MKNFNLLTPTNRVDDWNFKENEVGFFLFKEMSTATIGTRKKCYLDSLTKFLPNL